MTQAVRILGFMVSPSPVHAALERAEEGRGVSRDEALSLMEAADLPSLLHAAASVRDGFKGHTVSYSRKVFIPLTHLCRDYCGYCTFRADPEAGRQPYMTPEDVLAVAEAGRRASAAYGMMPHASAAPATGRRDRDRLFTQASFPGKALPYTCGSDSE